MREVTIERNTNETQIELTLNLDRRGPVSGGHRMRLSESYAGAVCPAWPVRSGAHLPRRCGGGLSPHHRGCGHRAGAGLCRGAGRYAGHPPVRQLLPADGRGPHPLRRGHLRPLHPELGHPLQTEKVGDFDVECAKEFWLGFARSVPATVHFVQFAGENTHHILEAAFKGWPCAGRRRPHRRRPPGRDPFHERTAGMICIIDYGVGNLFSLKSSLAHLGLDAAVSADPADIRAADRLILPGAWGLRGRHGKARGHRPCAGHQGGSGEKAPPWHLPRDAAAV